MWWEERIEVSKVSEISDTNFIDETGCFKVSDTYFFDEKLETTYMGVSETTSLKTIDRGP